MRCDVTSANQYGTEECGKKDTANRDIKPWRKKCPISLCRRPNGYWKFAGRYRSTDEELIKIEKGIGLTINSGKIKYMTVKRGGVDRNNLHVECNTFERVQELVYLGSALNNQGSVHGGINIGLDAANRCLMRWISFFNLSFCQGRQRNISYNHPMLTYAWATWATTRCDGEKLRLFERKVLGQIYGPVIQQYGTEMENKKERPNVPPLQMRSRGPICRRDKDRMGRPWVCWKEHLKDGKDGWTTSRNY